MRQKKNKGYKKSHKIYALTVIVLGLAIILMALFLLFYVQKIEVKGNEYTDSQEIVDLVEEDPLAINSLYLLYKYRFTDYDMPGSLNSISVSLRAPWSVQVTVDEKSILGYVTSGEQNVYFDGAKKENRRPKQPLQPSLSNLCHDTISTDADEPVASHLHITNAYRHILSGKGQSRHPIYPYSML